MAVGERSPLVNRLLRLSLLSLLSLSSCYSFLADSEKKEFGGRIPPLCVSAYLFPFDISEFFLSLLPHKKKKKEKRKRGERRTGATHLHYLMMDFGLLPVAGQVVVVVGSRTGRRDGRWNRRAGRRGANDRTDHHFGPSVRRHKGTAERWCRIHI